MPVNQLTCDTCVTVIILLNSTDLFWIVLCGGEPIQMVAYLH